MSKINDIGRPPIKLLFGTPEFILEPNVVQTTVRVGAKWRDDLKDKGKIRIPCIDLNTGERTGDATVVETLFGSFKDLGYFGSVCNHQANCRDYDGLIDVLSECYPGFDPDTSQITVILFKYVSDNPIESPDEEIDLTTEFDYVQQEEGVEEGSWFFYSEDKESKFGPYDTEEEARTAQSESVAVESELGKELEDVIDAALAAEDGEGTDGETTDEGNKEEAESEDALAA